MKTRILFFTALLSGLISFNGTAQITYYDSTGIISRTGYVYKCDNPNGGHATLYNANDRFTYAAWARKDGQPISEDYWSGYINTVEITDDDYQTVWDIIHNTFTPVERASFGERKMLVTLILNSTTGRVDEVNFEIFTRTGYGQIPIEKYRQIELSLKQNITTTITPAGKLLNYCMIVIPFKP